MHTTLSSSALTAQLHTHIDESHHNRHTEGAQSPGEAMRTLVNQWTHNSRSREALFGTSPSVGRLDIRAEESDSDEIREAHDVLPGHQRTKVLERLQSLVREHLQLNPDDADFGEHGAIVLDLDEAVHGAYSAAAYGKKGVEKGASEVLEAFKEEAHEIREEPFSFMRHEVQPENLVDIGIASALTVLVTPLALKALFAGIHEIGEANEKAAELKGKQHDKQENLDKLALGLQAVRQHPELQGLQPLVEGEIALGRQEAHDLRQAQTQNTLAKAIGFSSALSGGAIVASTATKLGGQVGLASAAGGVGKVSAFVAGSAPAATAATVLGTAATLALAPAAAVGAISLGAAFTIKSHKKHKALLARSQPTRKHLKAMAEKPGLGDAASVRKYQQFLETKITQRERFFKEFERSNKLFLGASSLYGAGALGKAALVGASLAGVGLLSNPVTAAATVAAGAVGGVGMALTSHQFLTGHGKQHRYDEYLTTDMPVLDRHLLASADLLAGPEQGMKLRSAFFGLIEQRDHERQDLLVEIANDTNRVFGKQLHSTDAGFVSPKDCLKARLRGQSADAPLHSNRHASMSQRFKANALGAGAFFQAVGHGDLKRALRQAKDTRMANVDKLSSRKIQEWLTAPQHQARQIAFMQADLERLQAYLEAKLEVHTGIRQQADGPIDEPGHKTLAELFAEEDRQDYIDKLAKGDGRTPAAPSPLADQAHALADFLGQLDQSQERIALMHAQTRQVLHDLEQLQNGEGSSSDVSPQDRLTLCRERYLALQTGKLYDSERNEASTDLAANTRAFAKYMLHEAGADYRHLRGILVETEMQATMARTLYERGSAQAAGGAA